MLVNEQNKPTHDQQDVLCGLEHIVELHYIGMPKHPEQLDLVSEHLNVAGNSANAVQQRPAVKKI